MIALMPGAILSDCMWIFVLRLEPGDPRQWPAAIWLTALFWAVVWQSFSILTVGGAMSPSPPSAAQLLAALGLSSCGNQSTNCSYLAAATGGAGAAASSDHANMTHHGNASWLQVDAPDVAALMAGTCPAGCWPACEQGCVLSAVVVLRRSTPSAISNMFFALKLFSASGLVLLEGLVQIAIWGHHIVVPAILGSFVWWAWADEV